MGELSLKTKKAISAIIGIIINCIFVFKYSYRLSLSAAIVCTSVYCIILCAMFRFYEKINFSLSKKAWYLIIGIITAICAIAFKYIPVESIRVDRWEMIQIFWDAAKEGIYPYGVHSPAGNYPGPMPVYFLISYPFYAIQEIGWMGIIALWVMSFYIMHKQPERSKYSFLMLFALLSVTVYYEIITRSTILLNSIIFLLYYLQLKNLSKFSTRKFYLYAILGGIIFSTRNVFAIPMILWGMNVIITKEIPLLRLTKWCLFFILSFATTFLPFFIANPTEFMQHNPFITQGDAIIPFTHIIIFIALTFLLPIILRKKTDIIFLSILLLFSLISYHVIFAISNIGINAYFRGGADISYYIFCYPFILNILTQKEKNNDK